MAMPSKESLESCMDRILSTCFARINSSSFTKHHYLAVEAVQSIISKALKEKVSTSAIIIGNKRSGKCSVVEAVLTHNQSLHAPIDVVRIDGRVFGSLAQVALDMLTQLGVQASRRRSFTWLFDELVHKVVVRMLLISSGGFVWALIFCATQIAYSKALKPIPPPQYK